MHLHSTPPLGGSRRNIVMPFGMGKLEWLKICLFVLTEFTNVTETQTPHDDIGRACSIARQQTSVGSIHDMSR